MGYALYLGKQCVDGWLVGRKEGVRPRLPNMSMQRQENWEFKKKKTFTEIFFNLFLHSHLTEAKYKLAESAKAND